MFVKVTLLRPRNPNRPARSPEDMDAAELYVNAKHVFGIFPRDEANFPPLAQAAILIPAGQFFIAEDPATTMAAIAQAERADARA